MYEIDVLFPGFPGKTDRCFLGWGSFALIRSEDRNVLLDSGGPQIRQMIPELLAARGLAFSDIDMVLVSHLHYDHAYNLNLFPCAQIVLSLEEWHYANDLVHRDLSIDESAIMAVRNARVRFVTADDQQIAPGITAFLTPGHTPGSTSYLIETKEGNVVFAGDALKNRSQWMHREGLPEGEAMSLKKIAKRGNVILPGHDGLLQLQKDGSVRSLGPVETQIILPDGMTANDGQARLHIRLDDI